MKKDEQLAMWRGRIARAQDKRDVFFKGENPDDPGKPPGADFAIEVYRGQSKPKWWSDKDIWHHTGMLKSAIRAAVPSLMYSNPRFRVFPARIDIDPITGVDVSLERARAKELWLNHIWKEANGLTHTRLGIQNAFFSIGVIKCGYRCQWQDDDKRGVFATDPDSGELITGADGDPELEQGEYLTDEKGRRIRDEYGVPIPHPGTTSKEEWSIEAIDARSMLFDVEAGADFFQHRYVIEEWVRPLDEVKNDRRFSPAARKRLTASESVRGAVTQRKSSFQPEGTAGNSDRTTIEKDEERLRGYDIYDFTNGRYLVLPECGIADPSTNKDFLLDVPMPPGMEHGPYRFLKYTEDIGAEWYPIPDAIDMALSNQQYCVTASQEDIHREHTKSRYLATPDAFQTEGSNAEEEKAKFAHGPDGTVVTVSNVQAIVPAQKAHLDPSFQNAAAKVRAEFNDVGGMPGEMRGVADADSATQASILASGAELRNNDRRDNQVATWLCEIGRALLMSGQANAVLYTTVIEKVTEQAGVAPFREVNLTPAELLGEFEVTVEIGSTLNKSDPRTAAQLRELLTAVAQNPWIATVKGLMRRALDGINLDPVIADELALAAAEAQRQQNGVTPEGVTPGGQVLPGTVMGMGNAAGGAPVGAPIN